MTQKMKARKNEDEPNNEDELKNENDLQNEEDPKMKTTSHKTKVESVQLGCNMSGNDIWEPNSFQVRFIFGQIYIW